MTQGEFDDGQGMPQALSGDDDISISNTGQRVRAILVVVVALCAAGAAAYWYMNKQKVIEGHRAAKKAFAAAHTQGYDAFWSKVQVDVKSFKTNKDFEARLRQITTDDPVRYAKFIKEEALPIWDEGLPAYQAIEAPQEYAELLSAVNAGAKGVRDSWNDFAGELAKYEDFFAAKKKLDDLGNAWLGAQQSKNEKHKVDAFRYFKLVKCILPEKNLSNVKPGELTTEINDSCLNSKAAWFSHVAFDCFLATKEDPGEPGKEYDSALNTIRKDEEGRVDHSSVFGIKDCLTATREEYESSNFEKLALAWANYVKAQNAFLGAVKDNIKALR